MRHIANPSGLESLSALVELIRNAKEVEKVLAEIEAARVEANEKIAAVGKIEEIEALQNSTRLLYEAAQTDLDDAKREAKRILGKAGTEAAAEKERQKRADEILADADDREKRIRSREAFIKDREAELTDYVNQTKALEAEAAALKVQAEEKIAEADRTLERIKQFADQID